MAGTYIRTTRGCSYCIGFELLLLELEGPCICSDIEPKRLLPAKAVVVLLMDKILHDPKDPKLWELWYIPYYG